jgi:drug/metabolite transporter (DMT)-like permease
MPIALSRKDLWLLVLLTVLWGINWPVMKVGVRQFPPLSFRTLCMVGGVLLFAAIVRAQGQSLRIAREHWREVFMLGLTNMTIWYVLSIYAVKLLSSGRAAILGYTMPVWVAIFGWLLYRDRLDGRTLLGVLAACVGIALLLLEEIGTLTGRPLGTVLMLAAAMVWAVGTQWMRRRKVQAGVAVLAFWMMVQALLVCSVLCWVLERDQWVRWPNAQEGWAIAYNIVLVFGVCQLLWFRLASILPPVASSLSVMMIPVVGLFSGMIMLGERPTWADYAALAFVLFAMFTVLLPARSAAKP